MRHLSNRTGFTVIEFVFATSLTLIVILVSTMLMVSSLHGYRREYLIEASSHASEIGIEYLTRDLRATYQVVGSAGVGSTSASSIVLQVPSYDGSEVIDGSYDYISYSVDSQQHLIRTTAAGDGDRVNETKRVLTKGVTNLSFTYICRNTFQGNGATLTFTLPVSYTGTPAVSVNGITITSGVTFNQGNHSLTFQVAPSLTDFIEVLYQVSPSNSAALAQVMDVTVQMTCQQTQGDYSRSAPLSASIRLRNKR